jgi:thioredoxin-related protein
MKKMLQHLLLLLFLLSSSAFAQPKSELSLGSKMPLADVKMMDISGSELSVNDIKLENGTLIVFSCNTCPYVKAWESRYLKVAELAKKQKIGMIALNPNEALRSDKESLEEMKKVAMSMKYTFPYVVDKNHVLADEFGATKTPHIYLFDKNDVLVYVGAIDDNSGNEKEVKFTYLMDALNELGSGKEITIKQSKALGCSIKRVK